MIVTAEQVKELRERTGAGMMECKKALTEANADIELAIENMRKAGVAKAAKKAGRIAAEGLVAIHVNADDTLGFLVEVNSETDFVSRNNDFIQFAQEVATAGLQAEVATTEALMQITLPTGQTIEHTRNELVAKLGENISVRRVFLMRAAKGNRLGQYCHGGRIGVLVQLQGGNVELAKDLAMHIAASRPEVVLPEQVSPEMIAKEREIALAQAAETGKPQDILNKMVDGRIKKFLNEVSLVGQPFVKDPSVNVLDVLTKAQAKVSEFARFEVGEGIEKKTANFRDEVLAQVQGAH